MTLLIKEYLVRVSEELQDLCEFEPEIETYGKTNEELIATIKKAYKSLTPDDRLSDLTITVYEELEFDIPKEWQR